MIMFSEK